MQFRPGARSARKCLGIVVTALSAAGCAPAPERASHTVEDYKQDGQLRREELARCAGRQFDPTLIPHFLDGVEELREKRTAAGLPNPE